MRLSLLLLLVLLSGLSRPAAAQQVYPWSAIGKLERTTGGYCTGVLIGRRVVLTAAHCFFNRYERRWIPAWNFVFTPGVGTPGRGHNSLARDYRVAPGYNPLRRPGMESEGTDVGIVLLLEGLGDEAGFLPWVSPQSLPTALGGATGAGLVAAGYPRNQSATLTVHQPCRVVEYFATRQMFLHDCISFKGESGSPLVALITGQYAIVGVEIGIAGSAGNSNQHWGAAATVETLARMLADPRSNFAPLTDPDIWGDPRRRTPPR